MTAPGKRRFRLLGPAGLGLRSSPEDSLESGARSHIAGQAGMPCPVCNPDPGPDIVPRLPKGFRRGGQNGGRAAYRARRRCGSEKSLYPEFFRAAERLIAAKPNRNRYTQHNVIVRARAR